jgi:hypothetical protein
MPEPIASILLIDDSEEQLVDFRDKLRQKIASDEADIRTWIPNDPKQNSFDTFSGQVDVGTILVITDYDLTSKGVTGLFGHSIVGWCQNRSIPVGDFSRGNQKALPSEPNLFELRVPISMDAAVQFTASTFRGFKQLRDSIHPDHAFMSANRSLAAVLASLVERRHLENQFALYMSRLGSSNSSLVERLRSFASPEVSPTDADKAQLLAYVLGHVLVNAILKFPGPILSKKALCAYVATSVDEIESIGPLFATAAYIGPFSQGESYYWREDVDDIIEGMSKNLAIQEFEPYGDFNRKAVESALSRPLAVHECQRCQGRNGGFLCPFTLRPVCQRSDCSISASSWIPQGAQLSRVEREFYDEWAPLLGL